MSTQIINVINPKTRQRIVFSLSNRMRVRAGNNIIEAREKKQQQK